MRVKDFMQREVQTVEPKTSVLDALGLMKKYDIKHLPVTRDGKLKGFVTRGMLREASPSDATSLDIHEVTYLISKLTVERIMIKKPITVSPDLPVEEVIWMSQQHGIRAFPVLEGQSLVGIISQSDIAGVVASALGVGERDSTRITIEAAGNRFGYLKDLVQLLDSHRIPMLSMMGIEKSKKGRWYIILRLRTRDSSAVVEDLRQNDFNVTDVT